MTDDAATTSEDRRRTRKIFRYSAWDFVPAALLLGHLIFVGGLVWIWPSMNWPQRIAAGFAYAFAIGWNLDSVAHNFIHNPFFAWAPLNRASAYALTLVNGVPQTMYHYVHMRHHAGNSDRPGPDGRTLDPISIYQFGVDGKAEPMWRYVVLQFWRDDGPFTVAREIAQKRPAEATMALREFWVMLAVYAALLVANWQAVLFLIPFYYLGQCFTALIAYYEHLGGDPSRKIAWGVSTYAPIYNWAFLNNGHHAEHHYYPKAHWSRMADVRRELAPELSAAGVRVLGPAHWLGFLARSSWAVPTQAKA